MEKGTWRKETEKGGRKRSITMIKQKIAEVRKSRKEAHGERINPFMQY
jgi:hypothetical protein